MLSGGADGAGWEARVSSTPVALIIIAWRTTPCPAAFGHSPASGANKKQDFPPLAETLVPIAGSCDAVAGDISISEK